MGETTLTIAENEFPTITKAAIATPQGIKYVMIEPWCRFIRLNPNGMLEGSDDGIEFYPLKSDAADTPTIVEISERVAALERSREYDLEVERNRQAEK